MGNRGVGSWMVRCRNCGQEHRITNFSRRRAITHEGQVVSATVHEAKCYGWELLTRTDLRWSKILEHVR